MFKILKFILLSLISLSSLNANTGNYRIVDSTSFKTYKFKKLNATLVSKDIIKVTLNGSSKYLKLLPHLEDVLFDVKTGATAGFYETSSAQIFSVSNDIVLDSVCTSKHNGVIYSLYDCDSSVQADNENWFSIKAKNGASFVYEEIATCKPDENLNTQTKECVKCPEGQSWNPAANRCYKDCSDDYTNKWGFTDGSCIDCTKEKTKFAVVECFCKSKGSTSSSVPYLEAGNDVLKGFCENGWQFDFFDPENLPEKPKDPKPDDNSTKPQDPKDPDTPDNPKDPKKPNDPGKENNNPNPNPDGPKPDPDDSNNEFCKKNPKDPKCKNKDNNNTKPKGPGGGGGGDDDGKDKDAKFNPDEFDDGGADKERDGLFGDIKDHINNNLSKFDGISQSINQFMDNVKGKGFDKVKADIKNKCPITREIPLPNGSSKPVTVDYCDIVSPVSEVTYYAFYIGFAVGGFLLFLKLLLLSF